MRRAYDLCSLFAMNLKAWRDANGQTLAQVAKAARTSDATISRIENRKQRPTPDLARRLEAVTGIPASVFVMGEAA